MWKPRLALVLLTIAFGAENAHGQDPFPSSIVDWEPIPENPVFKGEAGVKWDKQIRERGWILREGDKYRLWYTGYNTLRSPDRLLGLARSNDGIKWERAGADPLYSGSWVEDVCVVKKGKTYYMFAEGKNDQAHLMESEDGNTWRELGTLDIRTTDGRPISAGPFGTPTALFENDTWYLFYERGDRAVWLATSTDMKLWTNVQDQPVLKMGPELYDLYAVAINQVIKRDNMYYAFYHANSHKPWDKNDWTTCVARSKDMIHWEKYSGNPILKNNCSSSILIETPDGDRLYSMHPDVRVHTHPKSKASAPK